MPEKVAEMKRLFQLEASKYNVFPLDDRKAERTNPDIAGRPQVVHGNTQVLFAGMRRLGENTAINIKNKSHSITAELEIPSNAQGVIVAQGGHMGGWTIYVHEGRLKYHYNFLGLLRFEVIASSTLPEGKHQVRMEFTYDGGGLGKPGTAALYVDGNKAGEGRRRSHACVPFLDGRNDGCRLRRWRAGLSGLSSERQQVQWQGQLGADRCRRRGERHGPSRWR
jgi:arylsulfatase